MGECMIPKIIHYCWFGKNPKPKLAKKCIKSWKKKCPDYKIIEWNEDNFNISEAPLYVRQAYEAKKWAFVTDYVRLKVVYDNGGIYLDTDVELIKPLDGLLDNTAYFGFEDGRYINTGLGFGAEKRAKIVADIMSQYKEIPFLLENGDIDDFPCPKRNTEVFLNYGLFQDDSKQLLNGDVLVLPSIYLCPIFYDTGKRTHSKDTYSIHWFSESWLPEDVRKKHNDFVKKKKRERRKDYVIHIPNRIIRFCLGSKNYNKLKATIKK